MDKKRSRRYYRRLRREAVKLITEEPGISGREISRRLGITTNTACQWLNIYYISGPDHLIEQQYGGKSGLSWSQLKEIRQAMQYGATLCGFRDDEWTASKLKAHILEKYKIVYKSAQGLRKLFAKQGIKLPDERKVRSMPDIEQRLEMLLLILKDQNAREFGFTDERWTIERVQVVARKYLKIQYSTSYLRARLYKLGWSFKRYPKGDKQDSETAE